MTDLRLRLTGMWLTAMNYDSGLTAGARLHLEWLLGNEYRHTPRCRDCATPTDRDADHAQAAA